MLSSRALRQFAIELTIEFKWQCRGNYNAGYWKGAIAAAQNESRWLKICRQSTSTISRFPATTKPIRHRISACATRISAVPGLASMSSNSLIAAEYNHSASKGLKPASDFLARHSFANAEEQLSICISATKT